MWKAHSHLRFPITAALCFQIALGPAFAIAAESSPGAADSKLAPSAAVDEKEPEAQTVDQESAPLKEARELYAEGVKLAKEAQWSTALRTFERSRALHEHPMTTYNVGACLRALGQYTMARNEFKRALADATGDAALPESITEQANAFLQEIERVLVALTLEISPVEAGIAIDGRPLTPTTTPESKHPTFVAGLAKPAAGVPVREKKIVVVLNPGAHVITLSRKGYSDAIVNKTFPPGYSGALSLRIDQLPATLHVSTNEPGALLELNSEDMGPAPLDILRPSGVYEVTVQKKNFVPYRVEVNLAPGEEVSLHADLVAEKPNIFGTWWFWTGAAVVVAGAATATYYLTRPEPTREEPNGGNLGWVVEL